MSDVSISSRLSVKRELLKTTCRPLNEEDAPTTPPSRSPSPSGRGDGVRGCDGMSDVSISSRLSVKRELLKTTCRPLNEEDAPTTHPSRSPSHSAGPPRERGRGEGLWRDVRRVHFFTP